jgi:hypothetical protein
MSEKDDNPSKGKRQRKLDSTALAKLYYARCLANGEQLPPDDEAPKRWPILWELLTTRYPDDERVVAPARLSIAWGMGTWIVSVSSADLRMKLDAYSHTLVGAFDAWEAEASKPEPVWRTWGREEPEIRKRKSGK